MLALADILVARARIRDAVDVTPCAHSAVLSRMLGCELYLKLENLQVTGSFKERGALNRILQLSDAEKKAGVIAASAGNHAQGVAHAATVNGIAATIVMPETTPLAKIQSTRGYGATVILHGTGYDQAYEKACQLQLERGFTFVHAFDDPEVIAGQGTIGLEILEQVPDVELVVVPVGGGGLISGIALAIRELRSDVRVVGVEAERLPAMKRSLEAGRVVALRAASSIADGISVARVGDHTFPLVQAYVSAVVSVAEEEIARAIVTLLERKKTLAEGSGAVGLAALTSDRVKDFGGRKVVVVVSGGNIDMTTLARVLERGLEHDERVVRLEAVVPDAASAIAGLATLVAEHAANILSLTQTRSISEVELGETEVLLVLETRGHEHAEAIRAAIRSRGFRLK